MGLVKKKMKKITALSPCYSAIIIAVSLTVKTLSVANPIWIILYPHKKSACIKNTTIQANFITTFRTTMQNTFFMVLLTLPALLTFNFLILMYLFET